MIVSRTLTHSISIASDDDLNDRNDQAKTTDWRDAEGNYPRKVLNPLFTLGEKGDSRVKFHEMKWEDTAYLTTETLAEAGKWGTDIDARRLSLVSGAACGTAEQWHSACIRNFHPIADETFVPTKVEKVWVYALLGGNGCANNGDRRTCISMVRVKVFVEDGALKIKTMGAARNIGFTDADWGAFTNEDLEMDVKNTPRPVGELFNTAPWPMTIATARNAPSRGSLGIGGVKYVLAAEMVPSLALRNPRASSLGKKESTSPVPVAPRLGEANVSDTQMEYKYPHYFDHQYPGTTGCEAECEGNDVDEATCGSKFNCEFYEGKCWSRVSTEACPATPADLRSFLATAQGCSVQCEHETKDQCDGEGLHCTWSNNECWPAFEEPCPVNM